MTGDSDGLAVGIFALGVLIGIGLIVGDLVFGQVTLWMIQ